MSRRSALPGAAELFRATGRPADRAVAADREPPPAGGPAGPTPSPHAASTGVVDAPTRAERLLTEPSAEPAETSDGDEPTSRAGARTRGGSAGVGPEGGAGTGRSPAASSGTAGSRVPTGRERHDEKITVYVSVAELMDLERARLTLRGEHGLAVDRGRLVREALAVVLADLEAEGEASTLVRRLRSR